MSFEVYDKDGNVIQGVIPPDEVQKILSEKEEIASKLAKLENKEFNFKKLREMSEEEKSKLSEKEQELIQRQEEIEERHQNFQSSMVKEIKNDFLDRMAGDDKELRAKIEYNYNKLKDSEKAATREQISAFMSDALNMVGRPVGRNPFHSAMGVSGDGPVRKTSSVGDELKTFGKNFGLTDDDFKNFSN